MANWNGITPNKFMFVMAPLSLNLSLILYLSLLFLLPSFSSLLFLLFLLFFPFLPLFLLYFFLFFVISTFLCLLSLHSLIPSTTYFCPLIKYLFINNNNKKKRARQDSNMPQDIWTPLENSLPPMVVMKSVLVFLMEKVHY